MSGPVTISGFGSNMDINSIINGLVQANSANLNSMQTQVTNLQSANSTLSDIGKSLSALQTAAEALSTVAGVNSMTASSSDSAVVATATGAALPGSFSVQVQQIASAQKTYSAVQSTSGALGQSGSISIGVGGKTASITIASTDTLNTIASKINQAGLRVNASVFYDGNGYRLQVQGLDTGAANALTFTETGTTLDLNGTGQNADGTDNPDGGQTVQSASDATLLVDGFKVTRSTNQIAGVIPGVTLALTNKTSSAATVSVGSDPTAVANKVSAFVTAYNKVITSIHTASGYGTTAASNSTLAGDSALRTITDRLAAIAGGVEGTGSFQTLGDVGISLAKDGTLNLDDVKLGQAITADPTSVTSLFARATGAAKGGAMTDMDQTITSLMDATNGVLSNREDTINKKIQDLNDQETREQDRLTAYEDQLRTQFTAMDSAMAENKTLLSEINSAFGITSSSSSSSSGTASTG